MGVVGVGVVGVEGVSGDRCGHESGEDEGVGRLVRDLYCPIAGDKKMNSKLKGVEHVNILTYILVIVKLFLFAG